MLSHFVNLLVSVSLLLFLGGGALNLVEFGEHVRAYTRSVEFDFTSWTLDAVALKVQQAALGAQGYLDEAAQTQLVREYIALVAEIQSKEGELSVLHANPDEASVAGQIALLGAKLSSLYEQRVQLAPLAEGILQAQVSTVLSEQGFTSGGQPLPPLLFHSTPLPWALIVSPRASISQQANISLETELTLDEHIRIEDAVAANLGVSTLVVPVGGVGTYPTMVAQTSSLNWLCEVISHEWTHNYLTWHPLGALYFDSPELTTMNETTANIVGKEIGAAVIARYYPDLAPPPAPRTAAQSEPPPEAEVEPPAFDYREEMHRTRLRVDELLAAGRIEEAESYMEQRRLVFWEHGYIIRKLNQAYFAFYGSYADTPTGPAGADPVGAAVRALRERSGTLREFVAQMAGLTSFEGLQSLLSSQQ
jgi:hypothetical protein